MDKFILISNTKTLTSYEDGELQDICEWNEQELNTDFTDWQWNGDDHIYERDQLVDGEDCELSSSELEDWKAGNFEAYNIYSRAEVYDLVRIKEPDNVG